MPSNTVLTMQGISKYYAGIRALEGVDFDLKTGEVHALIGENGAGKSTLMKILSGVVQKDAGRIEIKAREINYDSPHLAQGLGISMIHQEGSLVPYLTAAQNIWLGREPVRRFVRTINNSELTKKAREIMNMLGPDVPLDLPVRALSSAQKQLIEIAKAISLQTSILIMDEPTSSLTDGETEVLFEIIRNLTAKGTSIIYVSHRMKEILALSHRITILRDGKRIGTVPRSDATNDGLVQMMVGRRLENMFERTKKNTGPVVLEVENLSGAGFQDISFEVHQGEIVGFAGLIGSGRTELARAIFGADTLSQGKVVIGEKPLHARSPKDAIAAGVGLVPEDRKEQGLFLELSVSKNLSLVSLKNLTVAGMVRDKKESMLCNTMVEKLNIKLADVRNKVKDLSGGNQQKVVVGKWLALDLRVLIMDEPTRGIDVGAKAEIAAIMNDLAQKGMAIIMISSELPELALCDRVFVLSHGKLRGCLAHEDFAEKAIMDLMFKVEH